MVEENALTDAWVCSSEQSLPGDYLRGGIVKRTKWAGKLLLWSLMILCAGARSKAQQTTASIRGRVIDASGGIVRNASVTATQVDTSFSRNVESDSLGNFIFVELPLGSYQLEAEAKGFRRFVQEGITLHVDQTASLTVQLAVGTATETVEVNANASMIEPTTTNLGTTIGDREVLDLPLNGRHFTQLGVLQPGVVPITPGLAQAGGTLRDGQAYAVNGQRPESNNFLIDGSDNFNGVDGGFVLKPPVDAISEFRIITHNANAEFGNSLGSTTNIITRSGGNSYHGALWEFLRNNVFDSTNYFGRQVEPLKQNQFGGTFGGPIRENKTFIFGFYEGFRNRQGETALTTVPS